MQLLRSTAIRALEALYLPHTPLMERAGLAAADLAVELINQPGASVLVVAGTGNNGSDAYVCARHLKVRGHAVLVASPAPVAQLPADAEAARAAWVAAGGNILDQLPTSPFALVIDGLFGIGLSRAVEGRAAEWIHTLNTMNCPVLALDIPSGLHADTGAVMGCAVRADHTLSFLAAKPGLYTLDGRDHAGTVHVATLGTEADKIDSHSSNANHGQLIASANFKSLLQARRQNSHKGSYGSTAIIGGAPGMAGAALLASRAALHLGAGKVYVGMLAPLTVDPLQPELMLHEAVSALEQAEVIGIGPGLGQSETALALLKNAIHSDKPLVLDADAINLLAMHPVLAARLARRNAATVMTPHPTEAARLLGCDTAQIQADRIVASREIAQRCNAAVVLKGSGSVVALANGNWFINGTGNPALASGGTGDVLLGMVTALLAQADHGKDAAAALLAAVHLHGAAADALVAAGHGPIGLTASELIPATRQLWNRWITPQ